LNAPITGATLRRHLNQEETVVNRRTFCKGAAGMMAGALVADRAFGEPAPAVQSGGGASRRPVTVGGRRVKTVDVHAHCVVPGVMELMGQKTPSNAALIMGTDRVPQMDAQGIDVEVLSINPFWYSVERDLARSMIKTQNDKLSAFCAAHPDRFVGLATVALQHPDLAADQLEEGMKHLGLHGVSIGASVNGEELSSSRLDPFWAKAESLRAPIFIHPQGVPELRRLQGNGVLTNVIGNPLDTTIALSHLIFEGTLDRFPGLRICAAHGGGYLPSYADRSDHGCVTFPEQCSKTPNKRPTEYLKRLYFDSLVFSGEALRHLVAVCGAGQVVLGTDYPYPWTSTAVDHVLGAPGLSDADRLAILGGNAATLLNIAS
jgi:aminocarboxymuconate-semialdehyde decarboxylase